MAVEIFLLQMRFLVAGEGWKLEERKVEGSYEHAGREASAEAHKLDERFGDDHFWTVDLKDPKSGGSYFQLFHGRLS